MALDAGIAALGACSQSTGVLLMAAAKPKLESVARHLIHVRSDRAFQEILPQVRGEILRARAALEAIEGHGVLDTENHHRIASLFILDNLAVYAIGEQRRWLRNSDSWLRRKYGYRWLHVAHMPKMVSCYTLFVNVCQAFIWLRRNKLKRLRRKIMADVSKLNEAVATLSADVDKLIASYSTTVQPAIDAATAAVQAVDTKVVAATPAS